MCVQKLLARVIAVKAGKRSKIEKFTSFALFRGIATYCEQYVHLRFEPTKQSLVDFALDFLGRMSFHPACIMLVWKWVFSSSGE